MIIIKSQYSDHEIPHNKLIGDTKFSIAVNKVISDYWVLTGVELSLLDAMLSVLADKFDKDMNQDVNPVNDSSDKE